MIRPNINEIRIFKEGPCRNSPGVLSAVCLQDVADILIPFLQKSPLVTSWSFAGELHHMNQHESFVIQLCLCGLAAQSLRSERYI